MLPVPHGWDWNSNTSFLVLKDGLKLFEGNASEIANSNNEYIREYLSL